MKQELTPKQEKFCIEYVKTGSKSKAYRIAYNALNMKSETINRTAVEMFDNGKITARIEGLQKKIEDKELYTLEESIKKDFDLIKRYETALKILENSESKDKDITKAERTIKHIGSSGFGSAQDRISKKFGWYEKDNSQKTPLNKKDYSKLNNQELIEMARLERKVNQND